MKTTKKENFKKSRGITLIALVITIEFKKEVKFK